MKTYMIVYFGAAIVALFLVPIVSRLAKWYNLVDAPGPRKIHQTPIPRIGGIALMLSTFALVLPMFFLDNAIGQSFRQSRAQFVALLAGAGFIFAVGLFDDLRSVRGCIKLVCLIAASLAICASGAAVRSVSVGTWFELELGWAAWPLSVFWIVMITVCMNLIDGLDGLAGGIAAIVCGTIVLLALWTGQAAMAMLMLALLGSLTGFLFFNFHPAKIFMGDCGSMFLGFMIGAGSLVCQTKTTAMVGLALPFLVMGVPIFDAAIVLVGRRILDRRSMFAPDRGHLHHRMIDLGLRHRVVVMVIYAVTAVSASIGLLMLTDDGRHSIGLLVGGFLFLVSVFACLHGGRFSKILKALRRNWAIARKVKAERRTFENTQLRMRESTSFHTWWRTLCDMGKEMHFQSIGLWDRHNSSYVSGCQWNASAEKFPAGRSVKLGLPLGVNGDGKWEIKASIWADGHLEISGRQGMLLSRLMDEFPPPEQKEEAPSSVAMTTTQTLQRPAHMPSSLDILGIPVVPFESYDQALECVEEIIESQHKSSWVAINPIKVYHSWHKPELANLLRQIDVGICDGVGVSIASMIIHGRSIKRCTGCDLFFKLVSLASRKKWGVYLLGASAKSNAGARSELQKMYPGLRIVGWQDGYFEDSRTVIEQINHSRADLLFVAMGSPKQEQWICRHRHAIDAKFCMGVGGSFDIASGGLRRAPKVFRIAGTEFLFRLIAEPLKRWPIQKVLFPYFLRVIGKKMVNLTLSQEGSKDQALELKPKT